jgi:hypothetical protein
VVSADQSARNINPVGQLTLVGSGEVMFIGYREFYLEKGGQLYYEKATSVHIWAVEGSGSTFDETFPITTGFREIPLKMGFYWIEFGWPSGFPNGRNEFSPPYPYNDGGKG